MEEMSRGATLESQGKYISKYLSQSKGPMWAVRRVGSRPSSRWYVGYIYIHTNKF